MLLCSITNIYSQQISIRKAVKVDYKQVSFNFSYAEDINIHFGEYDSLEIQAIVQTNNRQYIDKYNLNIIDSNSNGIFIESKYDESMIKKAKINSDDSSCNVQNKDVLCIKELYDIYIPKQIAISVNTLSGNINITNVNSEVSLKTLAGDIDIGIKKEQNFDIECVSLIGQLYSDINHLTLVQNNNESSSVESQKHYKGKIGSGGKDLKLETLTGNIYLREN